MTTKRSLDERSEVAKNIVSTYLDFLLESCEDAHVTKYEILKWTAKATNFSERTCRRYIEKWQNKHLGRTGKKRYRLKAYLGIHDFSKEAIGRIIYQHLREGHHVTVKRIHAEVINDGTIDFSGSERSLCRILKELGFEWGKGDESTYLKETTETQYKRATFVRQYVKNMESENPKLVIFLDETRLFINGKCSDTGMDPSSSKEVLRRPDEDGQIVVIHAGTRNGFVPGVGLIFHTTLTCDQDYRGNMNGKKFEKWVKERLIPAIKNLGSCIIVMDNASYHSRLVEAHPRTTLSRDELINYLHQKDVDVPEGANLAELQFLGQKYYTEPERFIVDEMLKSEGHLVWRTPPNHFMFNAMEFVWSETKRHYNDNVVLSQEQGFQQSKLVWDEALTKVTAEKWANYVKLTEETIKKYYDHEIMNAPLLEEIWVTMEDENESDKGSHENSDDEVLAKQVHQELIKLNEEIPH